MSITGKAFLIIVIYSIISICLAQDQQAVLKVEKRHIFSNAGKEDIFSLKLIGKDTLNGEVDFQIISYNGNVIYHDNFDATSLIGMDMADNDVPKPTRKDSCNYIITRMHHYFDEKNFITPAILSSEEYDKEYLSTKEIWREVISDKSSIGFYYLVGEENNRQIVYSKKTKKVVVYKTYD
jgi:hypothetical protein